MAGKPRDADAETPHSGGRPRLDPDEPTEIIATRVPKSVKDEMRREAERRGVPLSDIARERFGVVWVDA